MARALELAARGRFGTSPNPMVGAVVARGDESLGEGYHERVGEAHAEVGALRDAGERARGATLYVTLEPCDHHGRTPPCSQAVIDAGIAEVVACHRDPDARVNGGGFERLRAAGVSVRSGVMAREAVRLNWRFLVATTQLRPAVSLKWAMSLDGKIATACGDSQWISSPEGRNWALELREEHDAILVGSGTVLADDPRLTRRLGHVAEPITRVVLDRRLRTPSNCRLLAESGPLLIYTTPAAEVDRRQRLSEHGAEVIVLEDVGPQTVLDDLYRRGLRSVVVEGGAEISGAFVSAGFYDRVAICCAPLLIGGSSAPGPLGGAGFEPLGSAPRLEPDEVSRHGPDIIISGFRRSCLPALFESVDA